MAVAGAVSRVGSWVVGLVVASGVLSARAAPPSARFDADGLVIQAPDGAHVTLRNADEKLIAEGKASGGRFVVPGETGDPMLRLVTLEVDGVGQTMSLADLFPPIDLEGALPTSVVLGLPLSPVVTIVASRRDVAVGGLEGAWTLVCDGRLVWTATGRASADGQLAAASPDVVPVDLDAGKACLMSVVVEGVRMASTATLTSSSTLAVSTDRPIYRPGDTVYARALLVDHATSRPKSGVATTAKLLDDGGRVVARADVATSRFGVASVALVVPKTIRGTSLSLAVTSEQGAATRSLKLGQFVAAGLSVAVDAPDSVDAHSTFIDLAIRATRLDGGPAAGANVEVRTSVPSLLAAKLDGAGRATVHVPSGGKKGLLTFDARVETEGGRVGIGSASVFVDDGSLQVFAIPESGQVVAHVPNRVWVVVLDGRGAPVSAATVRGGGATATTGRDGIAVLTLGTGGDGSIEVSAGSRSGARTLPAAKDGLLLSLDHAVLSPGQPLEATLRSASARDGEVGTVDVIVDGAPVAVAHASFVNGAAAIQVEMPPQVRGTIIARGQLVRGRVVTMDSRLLWVTPPSDLVVVASADRPEYRPKGTATLTFTVRDSAGRPVVAALGAAVVDAGLRALGLEQPGIERAVTRLGAVWDAREVAVPDWAKDALAAASDSLRLEVLASAATAALPTPTIAETAGPRREIAKRQFQGAITRRATEAATALSAYFLAHPKARRAVASALDRGAHVVPPAVRDDPWGVEVRLAVSESCCTHMVTVRSAGLDHRFETADDIVDSAEFKTHLACRERCVSLGCAGTGTGFGASARHSVSVGRMSSGGMLAEPPLREWFPDTLAVIPELVTGEDGVATWTVPLADSLTTWLVQARAISLSGGLGSVELEVPVTKPVSADVSVEPELTLGDQIAIPVELRNQTAAAITFHVVVTADGGLGLADGDGKSVTFDRRVDAGTTDAGPVMVRAERVGAGSLTVDARSPDGQGDRLRRKVTIIGGGVAEEVTASGEVAAGSAILASVAAPTGGIEGTSQRALRVYGSALGTVLEGLEGLLRMPSGCFEQTSSTTFPNAQVLGYLRDHRAAKPDVEARAKELLQAGWERLRGYEVKGGGFSWFGEAPANQVLTAFGLLEFRRMQPHITIDSAVVDRTAAWLMGQRQPDGSWAPDAEYLHAESWSSIQGGSLLVTAYITWALAFSAPEKQAKAMRVSLAPSVRWLEAHAAEAEGGYATAIVALALGEVESPAAAAARSKLRKLVETDKDGAFIAERGSTATHARGATASLETTGFAALAFLAGPETRPLGESCVDYLLAHRSPGSGWSSTQGTILALEATLKRERIRGQSPVGTLVVMSDGVEVGRESFDAKNADVVRTVSLPVDRTNTAVELRFEGTGGVRYQLGAEHERRLVVNSSARPMNVTLLLDKTEVMVGQPIEAHLIVMANEAVDMPLVTLVLPAGVEIDRTTLLGGAFVRVEVVGRRVALYGTRFEKGQQIDVPIRLTPRRAGTLAGGPILARAYYEPERTTEAPFMTLLVSSP